MVVYTRGNGAHCHILDTMNTGESFLFIEDTSDHGPNIYKDTKPKMSPLLVFYRVYRLEIQSVMLVFSTPLVK